VLRKDVLRKDVLLKEKEAHALRTEDPTITDAALLARRSPVTQREGE
jgi:hypothetical protein